MKQGCTAFTLLQQQVEEMQGPQSCNWIHSFHTCWSTVSFYHFKKLCKNFGADIAFGSGCLIVELNGCILKNLVQIILVLPNLFTVMLKKGSQDQSYMKVLRHWNFSTHLFFFLLLIFSSPQKGPWDRFTLTFCAYSFSWVFTLACLPCKIFCGMQSIAWWTTVHLSI